MKTSISDLPNITAQNYLKRSAAEGKYEIHGKVYTNIYPPIVPLNIFEQVQRRIEHNRIGQVSRETVFLLKGKVYCGYCGKAINGESGTSHTGKVMYYYKCVNKKRNTHNCKKATVRKDVLEQTVLDMAMELFTSGTDKRRRKREYRAQPARLCVSDFFAGKTDEYTNRSHAIRRKPFRRK